jgi:hypothetical protein
MLRQARDSYEHARRIAQQLDLKEFQATVLGQEAWVQALAGYF